MLKWPLLFILSSCAFQSTKYKKAVVYLHGMGKYPIESEKINIEVMRKSASDAGFLFHSPEAKGSCYYLKPPRLNSKCWDHLNIKTQINSIYKSLNLQNYKEVIFLGYSNGGYLLGGALQKNLLPKNVIKVGIASGGSIGNESVRPLKGKIHIYIENASSDKWNQKWVEKIHRILKINNKENIHYRIEERGHQMSPNDMKSFAEWVIKA
jgi:esterase/lipase